MKENSTNHWATGAGVDAFGFAAMPGGQTNQIRTIKKDSYENSSPLFSGLTESSFWWTSTESSGMQKVTAYHISTGNQEIRAPNNGQYYSYETMSIDTWSKSAYYSLRCVEDNE